jgi:hypothetical protein
MQRITLHGRPCIDCDGASELSWIEAEISLHSLASTISRSFHLDTQKESATASAERQQQVGYALEQQLLVLRAQPEEVA